MIVSTADQADKVQAVASAVPGLEWLVAFEPVEPVGPIRSMSWDGLKQAGQRRGERGRAEIEAREAALTRDDLATILYTSGTTGPPKGVMLTHGNLLSNAEAMNAIAGLTPDDVLLSWLPYSHVYARTVDHYLAIVAGVTTCLAVSVETLLANWAEVQPTWMTAVPRFYEKVWANLAGLPPEARGPALRSLFGPRLRQLSSGGAPLPAYICEGFNASGVPLREGYGLTESSPTITFNRLDRWKCGTVGLVIPGVELAIAPDGEILTRGPHVMRGYWNDPEATRRGGRPRGLAPYRRCRPDRSRWISHHHRSQKRPDHHLGGQEHRPVGSRTVAPERPPDRPGRHPRRPQAVRHRPDRSQLRPPRRRVSRPWVSIPERLPRTATRSPRSRSSHCTANASTA